MQPDRHGNHPVALETPLRQLLAELHPGPRQPRPSGYWPLLMRAAEALDSMEARAPWYGPGTKRGGLRRVAPAGDMPGGSGSLDDQARIIAGLPPGSENGRQAPDNLAHWGLKPGRAHRARLNWAHWRPDPGARARPSGRRADGPGRFRAQSQKPEHHPALT